MIPQRSLSVEVDSKQRNRPLEPDIALFQQFFRQCRFEGFTGLNATAGHMPAADIGVAHQEDTAFTIKDHGAHPQGHPACDAGAEQEGSLCQAEQAAWFWQAAWL